MKPDYHRATWRPAASTNFGSRPAHTQIDCIVLHATAGTLSGALAWFANPNSGVSAHYVVAKNGKVYQAVEEVNRAYHAGASSYQGRQDFNRFSIGIELVNENDGQDSYPTDQFEELVNLVGYLVAKYDVSSEWIVTHADISTVGKTDPKGFPVRKLIDRVFEPSPGLSDNTIREAAWNAAGIPFNPSAAFTRYARERGLGAPMTDEFDFSHQGTDYRGQGFARAIVYCSVGDWVNLREMSW